MLVKNRPDSLSSNIDYSWWECFGWGSRPDLSQLELLLPGFNIFQLPRPWCLEDVKEMTWKDLLVLILQMLPPRFPNLCTEFVSFLKAGWPFSTEQIGDSTARLLRFDTWSQCSLCDMLCCACDGEIPEVDKCKDPRHLVRLRTQKGGGELPLLDHSCLVKKCKLGAGERPLPPCLDRGDESALVVAAVLHLAMCHRNHRNMFINELHGKNGSNGWFGDHWKCLDLCHAEVSFGFSKQP